MLSQKFQPLQPPPKGDKIIIDHLSPPAKRQKTEAGHTEQVPSNSLVPPAITSHASSLNSNVPTLFSSTTSTTILHTSTTNPPNPNPRDPHPPNPHPPNLHQPNPHQSNPHQPNPHQPNPLPPSPLPSNPNPRVSNPPNPSPPNTSPPNINPPNTNPPNINPLYPNPPSRHPTNMRTTNVRNPTTPTTPQPQTRKQPYVGSIPIPSARSGSNIEPQGPVSTGPYGAGTYTAGPYSSGPYSSGPYSSAPYSSGPYSSGPYSAGPYPAGPYSAGPHPHFPHHPPHHSPPSNPPFQPHSLQPPPQPHTHPQPHPQPHQLHPHQQHPHQQHPHQQHPHQQHPHQQHPHQHQQHPHQQHPHQHQQHPHQQHPHQHQQHPHQQHPHQQHPHQQHPHQQHQHQQHPHQPHPPHNQYPFRGVYPRIQLSMHPHHHQMQSPPRLLPPTPPPNLTGHTKTASVIYRSWSESQVLEWFQNTFPFAGKYIVAFKECAIDGPSLDELTHEILIEDLNMLDQGHRSALLSAAQSLKTSNPQDGLINPSLAQGAVTDQQLKEAIQQIVHTGDLNHLTKKQIRYSLENKFGVTLTSKAHFISKEILKILAIQEELEERKRLQMDDGSVGGGVGGLVNEAYTHNCHYCKMRFVNPQKLISHMNTHKAVLPFECSTCGQRSKRRDKNERHEATAHRHVCPVCNKQFVWKRHSRYLSLEYHLEEAHGMS